MTRPVDRIGIFPAMFGMARLTAIASWLCVRCHKDIDYDLGYDRWSPEDQAEYNISGLCPECWAAIFPDEEVPA